MSAERIITPRSYTYGTLDRNVKRACVVKVDGDTILNNQNVSRYYVGKDGASLAVFEVGNPRAFVRLEWSTVSTRVVVKVNGQTRIARDVVVTITENGSPVVIS